MSDLWTRRFVFLLAGGMLGVSTPETMRIWLLALLLLGGIRLWFWKARDFFGQLLKPEITVLAAGFFMGVLIGFTGNAGLEPPLTLDKVEVTGVLKDWSQVDDGAAGVFEVQDAVLSANGNPGSEVLGKTYRLRVYNDRNGSLPEGWSQTLPGDTLRFKGRLEHPKPPGTPGQFNFPLYNAVRGLAGNLTAQGDVARIGWGHPPYSWRIRDHVRNLLEQWPSQQSAVLEGILFGDSRQIPQEQIERYQITGVLHVFSASGSNVAFVLALFWGAFRFLPPPLRIVLTSSLLVFYAVLCGGNPPIVRATLMGLFVLIGRLGRGKAHSLRNLFLAGIGLFLWQPLLLKDTGFQLSFMATWGIIMLTPKLAELPGLRRLPRPVRWTLTTTLAAQLATLPIMITAFHRLSLIGLLANLLVLAVLGSVFECGLMGVILSFSAPLALPFFQVSLWLLDGVNAGLHFLAQLPWADVWVLNPGILFWLIWYGFLAVLLLGKERCAFVLQVWLRRLLYKLHTFQPFDLPETLHMKNAPLAAGLQHPPQRILQVLGVFMVLLLLWSPWNRRKEVTVSFIDVGQGDSILVETSNHHALLIDTGPQTDRFDAGERIVLPFLFEKEIKHLDALILTHAHLDHVGGASAILKNIPVDWVGIPEDGRDWLAVDSIPDNKTAAGSGWTEPSGFNQELSKQLAAQKVETLKAGDRVVIDADIQITVLGPGEILKNTHSDENNHSLILRLENAAGQRILLGADMEAEEMKEIQTSGQDFAADIFKIPHHGSRFSLLPDWLDRMEPRAVILSVGKNTFGHPYPGVLQYWNEHHVPLYRTDEAGTIRVILDEEGIQVIPGR